MTGRSFLCAFVLVFLAVAGGTSVAFGAPTDVGVLPDTVATGTDTGAGYTVGSLRTYDVSPVGAYVYSIVGGADGAKFSLAGTQLILTDGSLKYDQPTDANGDAVYEVMIRATDSGNASSWLEKILRIKLVAPLLHTSHTMQSDAWGGEWGTRVVGAKYGIFQCTTCHTRNASNIKRIKSTIVTPDNSNWESSLDPNLTVVLQNPADGASDFGDDSDGHTSSTRVCEGCHSQNRFHNFDSLRNQANDHENKSDCTRCHKHTKAFKAVGTACNQCHGSAGSNAPDTGAHATHSRFISANKDAVGFDASDCDLCHSNVLSGAATGTLQYSYDPAFDRTNGYNHSDASGRVIELTASVGYDSSNKTCSNACHRSSASDGYWGDANGLNCDACHYYAAAPTAADNALHPTPLGGKHNIHFTPDGMYAGGVEYLCSDCHGTMETQGPGPLSHKHAKDSTTNALWLVTQGKSALNPGGEDVYVDDSAQNAGAGSTWVNAAGNVSADGGNTCSNSRCHNPSPGAAFAADWDGTLGDCGGCHGYNDLFSAPDIVSGSHNAHMRMDPAMGPLRSCATIGCHSVAVHLNGRVDLPAAWTYDSTTLSQPAITQDFSAASWGSCTITVCHQDGTGVAVKSPKWGQTAGGTCNGCHGVATNGLPQTSAHAAHLQDTTFALTAYNSTANNATPTAYNFGCSECHTATIANHYNGTVNMNVAVGFSTITDKCSTSDCHSTGAGAYTPTPAWTGTWSGDKCAGCHGNSPSTNAHPDHEVGIHYQDIYTGTNGLKVAGNTATSAHGNSGISTTVGCYLCHNATVATKANAANATCDVCHNPLGGNAAVGDDVAAIADKRKHVNRNVEVVFNSIRVKTTAQLRDDISGVGEIGSNWVRLNSSQVEDNSGGGYKTSGAYDIFQAATALDTATMYNATRAGCTVSCHNGHYIEWQPGTGDCLLCHTVLPK